MAAFSLSLDQVLEEFAMQRGADGRVLERYLRDYPQYARELIDLSQEMFLLGTQGEGPLAVEDQMRIDSAWSRLQSAPRTAPADPLAHLSIERLREVAAALRVPRQVIAAFRERTVLAGSVPKGFLARMAGLVGSSIQDLLDTLTLPRQTLARSHKADEKPGDSGQISFEQLLREADLPQEQIEQLLTDDA